MIRVQAHQGRIVEGHRQAGLSLPQQIAITLVGVCRRAEARELAHGPKPASVHGGLHTPGIWITTGKPQGLGVVEILHVFRTHQSRDLFVGESRKAVQTLWMPVQSLVEIFAGPTLFGVDEGLEAFAVIEHRNAYLSIPTRACTPRS